MTISGEQESSNTPIIFNWKLLQWKWLTSLPHKPLEKIDRCTMHGCHCFWFWLRVLILETKFNHLINENDFRDIIKLNRAPVVKGSTVCNVITKYIYISNLITLIRQVCTNECYRNWSNQTLSWSTWLI